MPIPERNIRSCAANSTRDHEALVAEHSAGSDLVVMGNDRQRPHGAFTQRSFDRASRRIRRSDMDHGRNRAIRENARDLIGVRFLSSANPWSTTDRSHYRRKSRHGGTWIIRSPLIDVGPCAPLATGWSRVVHMFGKPTKKALESTFLTE